MATQTGSIDLRGVKQSYEGVSVGGRNLLKGSMSISPNSGGTTGVYGWINNGHGLPEAATQDGYSCIHVSGTPAGSYVASMATKNKVNLEWGCEYRISCDLLFDKEVTITAGAPMHYHVGSSDTLDEFTFINFNNGKGVTMSLVSPNANTIVPANTWVHIVQKLVTASAPPDSTLPYPAYRPFVYGSARSVSESVACNSYMRNWMFEKGTKPTAWTPAPEDVASDINAAQSTADTAQAVANDASASAISAGESAAAATEIANEANTNASNAEYIANLATDIANEAKDNVSNIEQIVGSASWMTSHGHYDKSVDTEKDPSKDYYTIIPTAVAEPIGSPHNGFYYELVDGAYILSGDTAVVSGKTYYTLEATLVENPLDDPSANDYYELNLNESVDDYISSHISMNSEGLFVSDGSVSKVQISSTGVSIWNDDARIASYGSVARIGREDGFNIQIGGEDNEIGFYFGTDKMAYINGNELYVQNSLSFGSSPHKTFSFYQRPNGHFTLDMV